MRHYFEYANILVLINDKKSMPVYNKLVRDRIPEIIEQDGKAFETKILKDDEFKIALQEKLIEEVQELQSADRRAKVREELADILELIYTIAGEYDTDINEIEQIRVDKQQRRGGFDRKIFLIKVID